MARLAVGVVLGIVVTWVAGAALRTHAEDEDTAALADQAGVPVDDLAGALASQPGVSGPEYLQFLGLTTPTQGADLGGAVVGGRGWQAPAGSRLACIEAKESGGANVANRGGSGAVGVMQYMPGTFRAHAAEMGHFDWSPWTPWQARAVAAHDLALGRRAQWSVGGC
jgi:hypothetical protein